MESVIPSPATDNLSDNSLSPMLKQYNSIKAKHSDCILFFRLGDFYEMFYDDAKVASKILDLVLTSRGKTAANKIPMCGIPFHSSENYIAKLIKSGHKVAICEQMEDPALAKGIVRRDVTRIITAGTYLDENNADTRLLLALFPDGKNLGYSFIDPTTGHVQTNQCSLSGNQIIDIIAPLPIFECVFPESSASTIQQIFKNPQLKLKTIVLSPFEDWCFNLQMAEKTLCDHFSVKNLRGFGMGDAPASIGATGALLEYLRRMNKQPLKHIDKISLHTDTTYTFISPAAHRGLELERLIQTLDTTRTAMGKRKFRFWFYHPLKNKHDIEERQNAIIWLKNNSTTLFDLQNLLNRIPDVEKSISRLSCGYVHAKDLLIIRNALALWPQLNQLLKTPSQTNQLFAIEDVKNLREDLIKIVNEDIPLANPEGKIIQKGFHAKLDELRDLQENGRQWLKQLQENEIKRTGIGSLKIGFTSVFGYYIEITKTNLSSVPSNYIRKQTLVNAERFITPELKEYEEKILTAQDKIVKIENEIVKELQQRILSNSTALHDFCESIATVDVLITLADLAQSSGYIRPSINETKQINIKDGRHPVVEKTTTDTFVPNDTLIDGDKHHLIILTGPNMAGKSTYIRQSALLVIMAQVGSFIPAQAATIGLVDKIFTRIGAHDDISRGQSTFMVEMNETADILNNMTDRSLIILDEIGRGTSTYDGLSLAWALAEHFHATKARTLFATHFHELTALAEDHPGIENYNVAVKEWKDDIIFLHKIVPGSTDDSYGIYVAKLAGIPSGVIQRAKQILTRLETKGDVRHQLRGTQRDDSQLNFFNAGETKPSEIEEKINALDINQLTPMAALLFLEELKKLIK